MLFRFREQNLTTDPNKSIYDHWGLALKPNDSDLVASPEDMVPWEEVEKSSNFWRRNIK